MDLFNGEKLTRFEGVIGGAASDDGKAFVLCVDTGDGPLNLEVPTESLRQLLTGLLQASVACAERRSDLPSMGDSDPSGSVLMPVSDLQVLDVKGAHKRVVIRTGTVDFSLMLQTPEVTAGLIWALKD